MMSAMEEIQSRADNIMENIMNKESELAVIQQQAEKAEIEKKALEEQSNQMLDEKQHIESDIKQLIQDKFLMEKHIKEQENEVVKYVGHKCWELTTTVGGNEAINNCCFRTKFLLAPLAEKVSGLETELNTLTTQITRKQEELKNLKMKIVESGSRYKYSWCCIMTS